MAARAEAEQTPSGPATSATQVSVLAHVVLATLGVAFLLLTASPMEYTGVVGWDRGTGPLLLANALTAAHHYCGRVRPAPFLGLPAQDSLTAWRV